MAVGATPSGAVQRVATILVLVMFSFVVNAIVVAVPAIGKRQFLMNDADTELTLMKSPFPTEPSEAKVKMVVLVPVGPMVPV